MESKLSELVQKFRVAIENAKRDHVFDNDICFDHFPRGCCGPTSDMLAEYLCKNGYDTIYVCGWCGDQSHAWLILKDEKVREPQKRYFVAPDKIKDILSLYSGRSCMEPVDITHYEATDIEWGLIIDITADQFPEMLNMPIYIGFMDDFHKKFEFDQAYDYSGLQDSRLEFLYGQICSYIEK